MKRDLIRLVGGILLAGVAMLVVLPACGGSTEATTLSTATPQAPAAATPTPASVPATTSTPAPAPTQSAVPPSTPTVNIGSDDLLAKGKLIFERTAGGVGCAACHGLDGKGKSAPYIRGASESRIREALAGSAMNFIKLTDDEIEAVAAYLQWLATQP